MIDSDRYNLTQDILTISPINIIAVHNFQLFFPNESSSRRGLAAAARSCGGEDPQPDGYADAGGARL